MRYWDASALVAILVAEDDTDRVRKWLEDDPKVITWAWTRVEIVSAVERRFHEDQLTRAERQFLLKRFDAVAEMWDEVTDLRAVRRQAIRLLARHRLRAADAAQLGAAVVVAEERGDSRLGFACLDDRLAAAAEIEGFDVLGKEDSG
ncbi:MAG: type II toxin-antitoxin system VapC family toxin [Gammaproteobacteria bacterium]|nr:type II toxin-antitoxin system VapC family toxin [Gammaproteobacteria bacterium]